MESIRKTPSETDREPDTGVSMPGPPKREKGTLCSKCPIKQRRMVAALCAACKRRFCKEHKVLKY